MAVLVERGYSVLSLPQFTAWLNGAPLHSRPAALLTFDHCYADQLENVRPVLDSLKLPATFFPPSAGLAEEHSDVAAHWRKTLLELAQSGYSIGCHSHLHQDLTTLSRAELLREVVASRQLLEDILGQRVSAFCYPYGATMPVSERLSKTQGSTSRSPWILAGGSSGRIPTRSSACRSWVNRDRESLQSTYRANASSLAPSSCPGRCESASWTERRSRRPKDEDCRH